MLKDDELLLTGEDGKKKTFRILFTYYDDDRAQDYVFLIDEEEDRGTGPLGVDVFRYDEKTHQLTVIDDDEEYRHLLAVFQAHEAEN